MRAIAWQKTISPRAWQASVQKPYSGFRYRLSCCFSTSTRTDLRSSELTQSMLRELKCQPDRLWDDIHTTAEFGAAHRYGAQPEATGMARLALSDSDKQARDWFVDTVKRLGCNVTVDSIGNIFAVRPGLNSHLHPVFVGSHLDTQPSGGRFDGVLGVMAGIEMLRMLNDKWIETEGPVGVINWTNEEGARFPVSMMGSGEWAGTAKQTAEVLEINGMHSVGQELERIEYKGTVPAQHAQGGVRMAAHFELHIEQGPILEAQNVAIGCVTGSQAYRWYEITVTGRAAHAGTTPLVGRLDPMKVASRLIADLLDAEHQGGLRTVGTLHVEPGSVNTICEKVKFTVDMRHHSDKGLADMDSALHTLLGTADARLPKGMSIQVKEIFNSKAQLFDGMARQCVKESTTALDYSVIDIVSGAGHDSVNTAKICPTAMVFVPCKDGVSHHPTEWCDKKDCAQGTDIVIQSVLRYDQLRFQGDDR